MSGHNFFELADQWLAAYAMNFSNAPAPTLFILGHCIESYCKAALLTQPEAEVASGKRYGHDVGGMLLELQDRQNILQGYRLNNATSDKYLFMSPVPFEETSNPEFQHFIANQELYWVANFQKNLKYLGTPGRDMPSQFSLVVMGRNPYWIPFLRELRHFCRKRCGFETLARRTYLELNGAPLEAVGFVREVLDDC